MTFKTNWETASAEHVISDAIINKMVHLAYPNNPLVAQQMMARGCANVNIKIQLQNQELPLILRIYLRDPSAAVREKKLGLALKNGLPVPLVYFIGEVDGYHFSVMQFMPGELLSDLLLSDEFFDTEEVMIQVGQTLANLCAYEYPETIQATASQLSMYEFALHCLKDERVISQLGLDLVEKTRQCLTDNQQFFTTNDENQLVHGDFDPSNILVDRIKGKWKVTGILDWEFAFSGSFLCDVANMVRYAKQMPEAFEAGFLQGLEANGIEFPDAWGITVHLYNISALLDCLQRSNPSTQPQRCQDIKHLLELIIVELSSIDD